ncbi:hypothetical protein SADUNF_Sadunf01G0074400 [Salix dunnii]|uniref:Uncharacterized protein n=1 Tax=Salix dunnii TaxID=1413687 RepID=A0A835NB04_9ROSI|nr:hypothetical protein SADUNF_Sadunf01G0074400 [Salix dunnii]
MCSSVEMMCFCCCDSKLLMWTRVETCDHEHQQPTQQIRICPKNKLISSTIFPCKLIHNDHRICNEHKATVAAINTRTHTRRPGQGKSIRYPVSRSNRDPQKEASNKVAAATEFQRWTSVPQCTRLDINPPTTRKHPRTLKSQRGNRTLDMEANRARAQPLQNQINIRVERFRTQYKTLMDTKCCTSHLVKMHLRITVLRPKVEHINGLNCDRNPSYKACN